MLIIVTTSQGGNLSIAASIFLIFIFVVFILGVTYHHHEDFIVNDDCSVCSAIFNARAFLTQDAYQVFSNDCTISTVFIDKDIITQT